MTEAKNKGLHSSLISFVANLNALVTLSQGCFVCLKVSSQADFFFVIPASEPESPLFKICRYIERIAAIVLVFIGLYR